MLAKCNSNTIFVTIWWPIKSPASTVLNLTIVVVFSSVQNENTTNLILNKAIWMQHRFFLLSCKIDREIHQGVVNTIIIIKCKSVSLSTTTKWCNVGYFMVFTDWSDAFYQFSLSLSAPVFVVCASERARSREWHTTASPVLFITILHRKPYSRENMCGTVTLFLSLHKWTLLLWAVIIII